VYVISAGGSAVFQMVQLGEERGNNVEVITGLKKGDRVISDKHLGRLEGKTVVLAQQ
jgi:hypothetical protein